MENKTSNAPLIGGVIAAIGAGLCCAGPLVLLLLGIGGSWIGTLTLFEPYRPFFIFIVVLLFGLAGYKLYRRQDTCEPGTSCAIAQTQRRRKVIFWLSSLIALILVTSNYWVLWVI
ncbi:mercuric transporter MerT family protein [Gammaproteobacteria bacterium AS21]